MMYWTRIAQNVETLTLDSRNKMNYHLRSSLTSQISNTHHHQLPERAIRFGLNNVFLLQKRMTTTFAALGLHWKFRNMLRVSKMRISRTFLASKVLRSLGLTANTVLIVVL